jgi:hypothetical protein
MLNGNINFVLPYPGSCVKREMDPPTTDGGEGENRWKLSIKPINLHLFISFDGVSLCVQNNLISNKN